MIIKEKFNIDDEELTAVISTDSIGESLYNQSKLKMGYDKHLGIHCVPK